MRNDEAYRSVKRDNQIHLFENNAEKTQNRNGINKRERFTGTYLKKRNENLRTSTYQNKNFLGNIKLKKSQTKISTTKNKNNKTKVAKSVYEAEECGDLDVFSSSSYVCHVLLHGALQFVKTCSKVVYSK